MTYDEENFPVLPKSWLVVTVESASTILSVKEKIPVKNYLTTGNLAVIDQGAALIGGYTNQGIAVTDQLPVVVFGDHTRALKYIDFPFAAGADGIKVLAPNELFFPRAFFRFVQAIKLPDRGYARHYQHLRNSQIPLPPLNEQKRIADKLDAVLARADICRDRLDRIPAILKRFRQSVLASAIGGYLTEDWRSKYHLNEKWERVRLNQVGESRLGKMLDKNKNVGEETPYIRNINVRWFAIDLNDILSIRVTQDEKKKLALIPGDVLICEGGEPGRCSIWKESNSNFVYQKALHRVRLGDKCIPEWFCYALKHAADSEQLAAFFTGTTIKHLTGVALTNWEFLLPSVDEQTEIVRRVESLFAYADRMEARYNNARAQVEKLTSALLAKAFRGELVPQDPKDEPASELLARIHAQRNSPKEITNKRIRSRKRGEQ
ncbi:restriction endonuclease subunit S [Methylicorpusculum sp.]|uniref:restriction endonuclease subunit S n=1 Tax=Methylicorpusculum sp. TaxID=2713644 RepID=UPI002731DCA4|nr:restriction endonuclease subunit S [Methylicorpusculum sp.]MDP2177344.1 restriction endonuclease subunit S [Methylicorpusculum sp.]MDP3531009.1 restriction endonuclease subunit S [Methylicorpusculum sp.]